MIYSTWSFNRYTLKHDTYELKNNRQQQLVNNQQLSIWCLALASLALVQRTKFGFHAEFEFSLARNSFRIGNLIGRAKIWKLYAAILYEFMSHRHRSKLYLMQFNWNNYFHRKDIKHFWWSFVVCVWPVQRVLHFGLSPSNNPNFWHPRRCKWIYIANSVFCSEFHAPDTLNVHKIFEQKYIVCVRAHKNNDC